MVSSYEGNKRQPTRQPEPRVADLMDKTFVRLQPDIDLYDAMNILLQRRITGAPVVNNGRVVGMISERDCLRMATIETYDNMGAGGPVSEFMSKDVITISGDASISTAARMFVETPYKKIPVVDGELLVGILRRCRILAAIQECQEDRLRTLQATRVVTRGKKVNPNTI